MLEQLKTVVTAREEEREMLADLWKDGLMKVDIKGDGIGCLVVLEVYDDIC
jgi:hypothetical protein